MQNIPMSVEMTKAILDGRKVQTRRAIKYGNYLYDEMNDLYIEFAINYCDLDEKNNPELKSEMIKHCKYRIGETIWAREPARVIYECLDEMKCEFLADGTKIKLDIPDRFIKSRADMCSMWLPKWIYECQGIPNGCIKEMARIFLKITNVRVERLQDISSHDIFAEGIPAKNSCSLQEASADAKEKWIKLWNSTAPNGYKWEDNPYVFVYEFGMVER